MKSQLRIRFFLPLLLIAAGGLAVFQLGLLDKIKGSGGAAKAAVPAAVSTATETTAPNTATATTETAPTPADGHAPEALSGVERLAAALSHEKIVVVVVYAPEGSVDTLEVADARTGADDAKAGFLALDASKESDVGAFAETYDVRTTPTVLVFRRGPQLVTKFGNYADSQTVAQAAQDARHA
jgi:hypothetical protein